MIFRRKGREFALQSLYALELGEGDLSDLRESIVTGLGLGREEAQYGAKLIQKVLDHVMEIDEYISQYAKNWSLNRIAVIDKILMRCSAAEMLYMNDVPVRVSITEAVQMAKKYSTEESAMFVNGILDTIARELSLAE